MWLFKRGIIGIMHMDFTELPGRAGWLCWKLGIIKFWRSTVQKKKYFKKSAPLDQILKKYNSKKEFVLPGSGSHKHIAEIDE